MKRIILLLLFIFACAWQVGAQMAEWEFDQLAVREAVAMAEGSLKRAPFGNNPVALLPLQGDVDGVMAAALKNLLTKNGFNCVEGKEDPMWNEIIKEVEWDERKDDILQPATVVRFGKLQAAKILVYGGIRTIDQNAYRVYAEVDLHATNLETKQHIWGGTFASRVYFGMNVNGLIALDSNLKQLLKKSFNDARDALRQPASASRLANIKTVAVVPLVGDIDQYMTGLAFEMLTETNHAPKTPQVPSLLETRMAIRNCSLPCDAVFYGYVRDLSMTPTVYRQLPKEEKVEASCTYNAEIQMVLEDAVSGAVLWSKTVAISETVREDRTMTVDELRKALQDHDERETLKRIRLEKAEKEGTFKRVAKEMEGAVSAARAALAAGRYAEVLVRTESVLNRADDDAQAAVWKKEALTLKKSAEEKLKAYKIDQIDQEVKRAVLSARESKNAGKWDEVRVHVEAATRIAGGSEDAAKYRQEAMTMLAQAESWKLDQALSKVDAEIESLLKTAREAMKTNRLDIADIYARMALRMEGGTPKADMLRNEAKKLVDEIAAAIKGAKVERIDAEIKGMVDAARNAMQQFSRLEEAAVYAKIATAIDGGSDAAEKLRAEAKQLVQEIAKMIDGLDTSRVEKEIEQALKRAEQAYQMKKWDDALYLARAAMNMVDFTRTAASLKTQAESLKKQIDIALQDDEISSVVAKAQAAYEVDDLNKARGYALAAIGMDYASEKAKNQRTKAQGLLEAIKIRKAEIEKELEEAREKQQEEALQSEVAQADAAFKADDLKTALMHAVTAIGMSGESDTAKYQKAKAQALLKSIKARGSDLEKMAIEAEKKRQVEVIRAELNLAEASKEGGLLEKALIHATTAQGMAGGSFEAENLKAKASALVENIKRIIEDELERKKVNAIRNLLLKAQAEFEGGMLQEARTSAVSADGMPGDSAEALELKANAKRLLGQINEKLTGNQEIAIRNTVNQAQAACDARNWDQAIQYAIAAIGMPGESDTALSLKAQSQGIKAKAEEGRRKDEWKKLAMWVGGIILGIVLVFAFVLIVKMIMIGPPTPR